MATVQEAAPEILSNSAVAGHEHHDSVARLRVDPQRSDIRALGTDAQHPSVDPREAFEFEAKRAFELGGGLALRDLIQPPPLAFDAALERYTETSRLDSSVLHALRIGDLPQAVSALLEENLTLRSELEASLSDFEALRAANVALEVQMEEALAVADNQRIALLDELERASDQVMSLEDQLRDLQAETESELALGRQQCEALELEVAELTAHLLNR